MHIIYIHTHDTGRYIQPYGYGIPSPNVMNLAVEGTLFRHAYCAAPTCSASRSALLTGMVPHSNGMLGLTHRGFQLYDHNKHLANYLRTHQYETVLCGIQHESTDENLLGYQEILHNKKKSDDSISNWDLHNARKCADYIYTFAKEAGDRSLFLSYGMSNTHREFPEKHAINPNYVMPPFPLYDCDVNREDTAAYAASAAVMDKCTGIVMDALRKSGLENNTLVIFTTDHGIAFPMMKCTLYDSGIGVSLIIKFPGNQMAGIAIDALVSQIDLFPTICDFIGIPKPDWLQGHSIIPLLEGRTNRIRQEIFAELNFHAASEPMRCVRTERYKLIRRYDEYASILPSNIDDGPSKTFMLDSGLLKGSLSREMLFDLYLDPVERINLIHEETYAEVREDLSTRMSHWMQDTHDPLLHGKLIIPEGARINAKSTLSPRDRQFET